jgi:hypothetical protein
VTADAAYSRDRSRGPHRPGIVIAPISVFDEGRRPVPDGMKPGFQRVRTHSKPGFMSAAERSGGLGSHLQFKDHGGWTPARGTDQTRGKGKSVNVKLEPAPLPGHGGDDPAVTCHRPAGRVSAWLAPPAPAAVRAGGLTRRIRLMRRKRATLGYRILRVSHFLRAIARRGASADVPALTLPAGNTPEAAAR